MSNYIIDENKNLLNADDIISGKISEQVPEMISQSIYQMVPGYNQYFKGSIKYSSTLQLDLSVGQSVLINTVYFSTSTLSNNLNCKYSGTYLILKAPILTHSPFVTTDSTMYKDEYFRSAYICDDSSLSLDALCIYLPTQQTVYYNTLQFFIIRIS